MTPEASVGEHSRERPLKVAFVGQRVFFSQCAMETAAAGVQPHFLDFRAGAPPQPLLSALQRIDADVVLVFRPEIVPEGLFAPLRAMTIGYLTEPLPRPNGSDHHDLNARMGALKAVDPRNFDRIVSFDPLIAQTAAQVIPIWRSMPLPVADSLFMEMHERSDPPAMLFVGRSTEHRERLLAPIKRSHALAHIGHGLHSAPLRRIFAAADVQLNLHNNDYPTFENRVSIALAAGHLVISEPLSPSHGLRPGTDHLEVQTAAALLELADELACRPDAYAEVQREGRRQAERFRASQAYPTLVREALEDVGENGGR